MNFNKGINKKMFLRNIFSRHFIEHRKIYGFTGYEKNLCDCISKNFPKKSKLLEVGVGNGYPFADFFQKEGYLIHGIDLSPDSIEECKKMNPDIECKVSDAENLEYPDNYFDRVYCFHSTSYFPDLNKVIDEMIRVTCSRGMILFDIQNHNNESVKKSFKKHLQENSKVNKIIKYIKNFIKVVLQYGKPTIITGVYEVPRFPESIYEHLKDKYNEKITFTVMVKKEGSEHIQKQNKLSGFEDFHRVIFMIEKK